MTLLVAKTSTELTIMTITMGMMMMNCQVEPEVELKKQVEAWIAGRREKGV